MKIAGFTIVSENPNANAESTRGGGTRRWSDSKGPFIVIAPETWPEPGVKHVVIENWILQAIASATQQSIESGDLEEITNDPRSLIDKINEPAAVTVTWDELSPASQAAARAFGPGAVVRTTEGVVVTPEDLPGGLAHTPKPEGDEALPEPGEEVDIEDVMRRLQAEEGAAA